MFPTNFPKNPKNLGVDFGAGASRAALAHDKKGGKKRHEQNKRQAHRKETKRNKKQKKQLAYEGGKYITLLK